MVSVRSSIPIALAAVLLLLAAGCGTPSRTATREEAEDAARKAVQSSSGQPASSRAPVNAECPVMGGPIDPQRTVIFEDQKVAFCCGDCTLAWLQYTDEERRTRLAAAMEAGDG